VFTWRPCIATSFGIRNKSKQGGRTGGRVGGTEYTPDRSAHNEKMGERYMERGRA